LIDSVLVRWFASGRWGIRQRRGVWI